MSLGEFGETMRGQLKASTTTVLFETFSLITRYLIAWFFGQIYGLFCSFSH